MRAVIIATGQHPQLGALEQDRPSPLLRIGDKPILFHVIDWCAQQGATQIDLILHYRPELIRAKLEDGGRWGVELNFHTAKAADWPLGAIQPLARRWQDETVLLGMGDHLPGAALPEHPTPKLMLCDPDGKWSGWSLMPASSLAALPSDTTRESIPEYLSDFKRYICPLPHLSTQSTEQFVSANARFLSHNTSSLVPPTTAKEVETGIWLSTNTVIHPTAEVIGPVFIGRNTQIGEGVRIGPHVVIENNCIIDSKSRLQDSIVCQNSYVGEGLDLVNNIVDRRWIINTKDRLEIPLTDDVIVSELLRFSFRRQLFHFIERIVALGLLTLLAPLLVCIAPFVQIQRRICLSLPANFPEARWKSFERLLWTSRAGALRLPEWIQQLPTLWNIVRGEMHFVGVKPRPIEEVRKLPTDWRSLYLGSKAGWITPQAVELNSPHPSFDEIYVTDVYYAAHDRPRYDLHMLWKYFLGSDREPRSR
ncbi:MAG: sugar transferase [Chlamydiia bacterium]|nr:sugar transferase [Chlamydiia bacterium]